MKITNELLGKRLISTNAQIGISRYEWTLLEISPSGKYLKFKNELAQTIFWTDSDEIEILEILN